MTKLKHIVIGLALIHLSLISYADTTCNSLTGDEQRLCQKIENRLRAKQQELQNNYTQALDKAVAKTDQIMAQPQSQYNYPNNPPPAQLQQSLPPQPSTSYTPQNDTRKQNNNPPASNSVNIFN